MGDGNEGFLALLNAISRHPTEVEPHTVHGRLRDFEANFLYRLCRRSDLVLLKCHYQKWRLDWTFPGYGWGIPTNIMVVPHGARPDRRWGLDEVRQIRKDLGLDQMGLADHVVGMIGWIQANKRWDILLSMWEETHEEILRATGQDWDLLAAGAMRDPHDQPRYEAWKGATLELEKKGLAHYFEFIPRGEIYYKVMAVCDFIVLPSMDETQSGTLARIIALNKPYITTAPMEGLTAQTLESEGGLLFTTKDMLKRKVIRLACDEALRLQLGENLRRYLEEVVSWEVVARQYKVAYQLAREAKRTGRPAVISPEF
ncbi:MAG: glycosyltransferase [Thermodesulfobacteriota bacterium]